ncbi:MULTISPECIES: RagB/SusD family nutrient uptake outer membrane protein [Emticicia]|uniref:RagB/SusD family nutrient uptake outer membrane protein n=1 Tax=Emticicia TaxID=312278 RepID=UPI0020A11756|nr:MULTISPECIES: RagB/SusD family nutrient uptake outer membrane protein [Emticicia]UTA68256.1 RagB/SusD family nutrient uptake outer membrane protein [Emticicia sp. 21SJ11W-3]
MKKLSILLILVALVSSSCEDYLEIENPNAIASDKYFSSEIDVQKAVAGIYTAIRSNSALGETSDLYSEERSDNAGRTDNQSSAGTPFQFTNFTLVPTNPEMTGHWNALYTIVSRANYVLSNVDNTAIKFTDEKNRAIYKSEALFLRALAYFHLVRKWGDVPMVTKFMASYDEIVASTFRVEKGLVYAQIVDDLTKALNADLPNIQPASGKGRTCKAAINGLLGQVYLTMGSVLADNKTANFTKAKQYLEAAYAMRTFGQLSDIPYADVFDVNKKNTNPEIIFQIVYKQGDQNYASGIAYRNQSIGETINSKRPSTGRGFFVNPDLVNEYEAGDIRKDFSVKWADHASAKAWFVTKYRDVSEAAAANGWGGNDFILMRYADIVLMLAEVNERLGNNTEAISYLNQARKRAGLPDYAASDAAYHAKYPTLKLAILHERRSELAFENHRLFDLLRAFGDNPQGFVNYLKSKNPADYGISDLKNVSTKDVYFPIPFDESKLDPVKMYQNPGY